MKKILVSGTFDPPTLGHLSIIKQCSEIFESTVVCVFVNPEKTPMFSLDMRMEMLREMCKDSPSVTVDSHEGMLYEYAEKNSIEYIARGIRGADDVEYEVYMARKNREYNSNLSTLFFPSSESLKDISSTLVRENINNEEYLNKVLPAAVVNIIMKNAGDGKK